MILNLFWLLVGGAVLVGSTYAIIATPQTLYWIEIWMHETILNVWQDMPPWVIHLIFLVPSFFITIASISNIIRFRR